MAKSKNVTFNLPPELIDKYKVYAKQKYIPSVSAGVREALEAYSKRIEKDMLKQEIINASKDPLFMKDLNETTEAFETIDTDANMEEEEW